jgi:hypothetical protein
MAPWAYYPAGGPLLISPSMKLTAAPTIGVLALAGCASIGPRTVARDRFDYVESISDSWKRQMLLNLVKVRYADAPVFLDITSVISSYEFRGELGVFGQEAPAGRAGDSFVGAAANSSYIDRPTITYAPLSSDKFAKALMSPFPITGLSLLLQSGYPADAVLRICANSINGLSNRYGGRGERPGDAKYQELLGLMREAQNRGDIALYSERVQEQNVVKLGLRATSDATAEARVRRIADLLELDGINGEFNVVYGARPVSNKEIAIQSRSMMQVLIDLSSYIEVPAGDIAEGRVFVAPRNEEVDRLFPALLRVHSSEAAPKDAHVAVRYRDGWFYIDDRDHESKAAFNFLMLLFSLTETGTTQTAPIVTVPAR